MRRQCANPECKVVFDVNPKFPDTHKYHDARCRFRHWNKARSLKLTPAEADAIRQLLGRKAHV